MEPRIYAVALAIFFSVPLPARAAPPPEAIVRVITEAAKTGKAVEMRG